MLDRADVAIVQHEYGIYGGPDGDDVVHVLDALSVPSIVVAHTVVRHPTAHQRHVLERVCGAADAVVVMTESARDRLVDGLRRRRGQDRDHPPRRGDAADRPPERRRAPATGRPGC